MRELSLGEIRQVEAQLLKYFRDFCRENQIRFFLSNGTLLGSVKYGGFIPWDDDIDVLVPRGDYDRLIRIFRDAEQYRLFSVEREPNYRFPFAKLCDMRTIKIEHNVDNGLPLGVDIDIFPLDSWAQRLPEAKREVRRIRHQMRLLDWSKTENITGTAVPKKWLKKGMVSLCRKRGSAAYLEKIRRLAVKHSGDVFVGCKVWPIYGYREILPAELFCNTVMVPFQNEDFPAPVGYEQYLSRLYGDYRRNLPPEQQKTHHCFSAFVLTESDENKSLGGEACVSK